MKKTVFVLIPVLIILLCIYAWFAHASIYWSLGDRPIYAPTDFTTYTVGEKSASSLTYVAIGDSVTAGVGVSTYMESYPYLIAEKLSKDQNKQVALIPFAIPGIRSEYVVGYFLDSTVNAKPDVITVFIGINDIHGNVPLSKFKERYTTILETLTKKTDADIYAINLPYIGTKDLIKEPYHLFFTERTETYNEVIKDVAELYGVTYVDLYTSFTPHSLDNSYYAQDFFHPNALGYSLWADTIYASFSK